jgi:predicted DNA-binding transcriptional regulator YafY
MEEILSRLERIDRLIRIKGTGSAMELARKIGVSRRSVFDYLNILKDRGAPIKYSLKRKTYYYEEDGFFNFSFFQRTIQYGK